MYMSSNLHCSYSKRLWESGHSHLFTSFCVLSNRQNESCFFLRKWKLEYSFSTLLRRPMSQTFSTRILSVMLILAMVMGLLKMRKGRKISLVFNDIHVYIRDYGTISHPTFSFVLPLISQDQLNTFNVEYEVSKFNCGNFWDSSLKPALKNSGTPSI